MFSSLAKKLFAAAALVAAGTAAFAQTGPDALVRQLSNEVIDTVKSDKDIQAGNLNKIIALVDAKVMPHVNFPHMTAIAVGRPWRTASDAQKQRLQDEFKTLLVRTYSGALTEVKDQTVQLKPLRAAAEDTEVVVRTEVKGKGEPIQLDYRLEKTANGWKIYDVNVLGVWLADTSFKSQFGPIVTNSGPHARADTEGADRPAGRTGAGRSRCALRRRCGGTDRLRHLGDRAAARSATARAPAGPGVRGAESSGQIASARGPLRRRGPARTAGCGGRLSGPVSRPPHSAAGAGCA
jgi:phospholipid transport system substrate-binding protein